MSLRFVCCHRERDGSRPSSQRERLLAPIDHVNTHFARLRQRGVKSACIPQSINAAELPDHFGVNAVDLGKREISAHCASRRNSSGSSRTNESSAARKENWALVRAVLTFHIGDELFDGALLLRR